MQTGLCHGCGQKVRQRKDGRTVWHRDPRKLRKWCMGSPGQRARLEARPIVLASELEAAER